MRLLTLIGFFFVILPYPLFADFQTQGFTQWDAQSHSFECEATCFVILGPATGELLEIEGQSSVQGMLAYGYLIDNQITPIGSENLGGIISTHAELSLHPQFSFLRTKPIIVIIQGKGKGVFSKLSFRTLSFSERVAIRFHEFTKLNPFTPATINLLYGPMFAGKSANNIFYTLFCIGLFTIILFLRKEKRVLSIAILMLSLWLIYDMRMSTEIIKTHVSDIVSISGDKPFRDRGDFYQFIEFAKNDLEKKGQKITEPLSFYSDNTWPLPDSAKYFLYPHPLVHNIPSDILLVYGYSFGSVNGMGITMSGSLLGTGDLVRFSPDAFIFYRKP